jgi:outer membrane protein assembly factor BamB
MSSSFWKENNRAFDFAPSGLIGLASRRSQVGRVEVAMKTRLRAFWMPPCVFAMVSLVLPLASMQECFASACWSVSTGVTQAAGEGQLSYYAVGSELRAVWSENGAGHVAGQVAWTWSTFSGAAITNFPTPVPASSAGPEAIYLGAEDGFLYKLDTTGNVHWQKDLRRPGFPNDQVIGSPAVQLSAFSNSTFQTAWGGNDAVFIMTRYLGSHTENRVYACFSNNGNPKWIFNSPLTVPMDYGVDGCAIDYATNTLFCGTELAGASGPTVFAIDTTNKSLKWSAQAGAIKSRPMFMQPPGFAGRLYVVTSTGTIRKYDSLTGAPGWNAPLQIQSRIVAWPEIGGTAAIFAVDQTGFLHGIRDTGPNTVPIFPPTQSNGIPFVTAPAVLPSSGKAYIGRDDGYLQQVCISNGQSEAQQQFLNSNAMNDPTLDASDLNRLLITGSDLGGLRVAQFCLPFLETPCGTITDAPFSVSAPSFALRPISPNPSTGSANIAYEVARDGDVDISVFDLGGRLVRSLVRAAQTTGPHQIEWDGRNDQGQFVANGVYMIKLRADGDRFEEMQKVVLMR